MNNPFITRNMTTDEAQELIDLALPLMDASGVVKWASVEKATGIGYARGWLIVRHAYLAKNNPEVFVDLKGILAKGRKQAEQAGTLVEFETKSDVAGSITKGEQRYLSPIIQDMKLNQQLSWGEIMVRTGCTEGYVRALFKANGSMKDLGVRNGHGGRFAWDDPTLYLDNRKAEGAQIPVDLKGKPKPEQLLNFKDEEAGVKRTTKKATAKAS